MIIMLRHDCFHLISFEILIIASVASSMVMRVYNVVFIQ